MTTTPNLTLYLADAANAQLEDWGPLPEATGPTMATAGVSLWEQGQASAGIWECAAGPSYWKLETHEVVQIISGTMTVTPEGGEPLTIKAGDTAVFPRGWAGTWEIHETIRKVYAIF